jgi:hypothetical protein
VYNGRVSDNRKKNPKRGPKPETLKLEGDWIANMKTATAKPKPAKGWPKAK